MVQFLHFSEAHFPPLWSTLKASLPAVGATAPLDTLWSTYRQREGTEGFGEVEGGQVTLGMKEDEWHPTHAYAGWEVKKCGNKATVAVQARSSKGLNQQGGGRSTMKEATKGLTEDE